MVSEELAPLEAHVQAQVKHLTAIAGVVHELRSVEEQYANQYAGLPFDLPADAKSTLKRLPPLYGVSRSFGHFVHKCSAIKAAVVKDLTQEVIAPLEAFTSDHVEKAQHLLSELYELLQKEKAFDLAYENLREGCKDDQRLEATNGVMNEIELQLHRTHRDQLLRKRDAERLEIQRWITSLHFAGQRYEAQVRGVLRQTLVVYDRMISSLKVAVSELQEQKDSSATNALAIDPSANNNSDIDSKESWDVFMAGYDCHIAATCWMSELFKQLIPVELKTAKSLQKTVKLDRAVGKSFGGVKFSAQLSGLIKFHDLLTVNIVNPIMRTLKYTRQRQERIRNELLKSLEETQKSVAVARARMNASVMKKEKEEEEPPVRCDSLTSSETSECSTDDNNEEGQNTNDAALKERAPVESTPEQIQLEVLEGKLLLQRQDMAHVLKQTSFLAVKTMELMVQDYLKHVMKALAALKEAMRVKPPATLKRKSDAGATQPWDNITVRLSITVSDQPAILVQESQGRRRCEKVAVRRRQSACKAVHDNGEPSTVQVTFSFLQTAVGMVFWAAGAGLKAARTCIPRSVEERALLAVIAVAIFALVSVCTRSNQLQTSWSDLADTQHSNAEDIVQIVKLSLKACAQPSSRSGGDADIIEVKQQDEFLSGRSRRVLVVLLMEEKRSSALKLRSEHFETQRCNPA